MIKLLQHSKTASYFAKIVIFADRVGRGVGLFPVVLGTMKDLDRRLSDIMERYCCSGIEEQVDYDKFYLYSIVTHSTAIEGSTITEIENQLLFDQGIVAKNKSMVEQMMNLDLKEAYLFGFDRIKSLQSYSVDFLCKLSAMVMRRTGSVYSTLGGNFDSSKGELRLCNVSAGIGGSSYMAFNKVAGATVARHIKSLSGRVICRKGSDKKGFWEIINS